MRILTVLVGKTRTVSIAEKEIFTGGAKSPVDEAFLRFGNFDGDSQGNLVHHGGKDRSACVYVAEHYAWWRSQFGYDLSHGAFCENLTIEGALEDLICIGDIYRAGKALVQVTQPRDPCVTIDRLTGIPDLWIKAREAGKLGFHLRTLEEGFVRAGDDFELVQRHPDSVAVSKVLDLFHGRSKDRALAERLARIPAFADQGKTIIASRIG